MAIPRKGGGFTGRHQVSGTESQSWSDAQKLMTRWGRWGGWYGSCNSEDCSYSVQIYHLPLFYPAFVFEEGPHIGARILQLVGLRSAAVSARFHVVRGIVTNKGFGYSVALPVSEWITPGGGFWLKSRVGSAYWPTLDVAFREGAKLGASSPYTIAVHPNHSLIHRRTILEVHFTPEETPEETAALTDVRFDCITRWTACSSRGDLLPRAAAEEEGDARESGQVAANPSARPICFPTVQIRAREEQEVLAGEVTRVENLPAEMGKHLREHGKWTVLVRLSEVLKGTAPVHEGEVFRVLSSCDETQQGCYKPVPGAPVILTGMWAADAPETGALSFVASGCGVIKGTPENLAAARKGAQQDFGPRF